MKNKSLYQQIISEENIKDAYLEVYESFLKKSAVYNYDVIDGQQLHETEINLAEFLAHIREEIIEKTPLRMAQSVVIPKKNGKLRKIYMMPVRERIKCQAIYRVLQEHLKPSYSKFLYSFRTDRHSYHALRSLRRYYLSNLNKGYYLLKTDFKDYSDHINKTLLLKKLSLMGVDDLTLALVQQFVEISFVRAGDWMSMAEGTMQGIPLVSLFNNVYMSQIDEKIGAEAEFYRRVGDDVIVLDKDKDKLEKALAYIREECQKMKIILNEEKTLIQPLEDSFDYLGLGFERGRVFIPQKKVEKLMAELKLMFKPKSKAGVKSKLQRIKRVLAINFYGRSTYIFTYSLSHNLVNDAKQLQEISLRIMKVLWAFLGGGFTAKRMAIGKKALRSSGMRVKSFFDHFAELIYKKG